MTVPLSAPVSRVIALTETPSAISLRIWALRDVFSLFTPQMYYGRIYMSRKLLTLYKQTIYIIGMAKQKTAHMLIRVTDPEKDAFELAASLAGISLSSWVRERLRLAAIRELESAGKRVPFVPEVPIPEA